MNANELRIGNWIIEYGIDYVMDNKIIDRDDKQFIIVDCHVIKELQYETENSVLYAPIPLTPEILEKCGFEKVDDGISPFYKLIISKTEVISIEDDWSLGLNAKNEKSTQGYATNANICQYLHQLQNLYYALTGQELTYQP